MQKTVKGLLGGLAIGGAMLGFSQNANALVIKAADFTFQSGAQFTGQISFLDDLSAVAGVAGTLTGYQDGIFGYSGSGSVAINSLGLGGVDLNPLPNQVATFLSNGVSISLFSHFLSFAYDLALAPNILLAPGGTGSGFVINVDFGDSLVEGSLSEVPVPASLLLLLSGLAGIGMMARSRKAIRS
jgi:hypothetical protein